MSRFSRGVTGGVSATESGMEVRFSGRSLTGCQSASLQGCIHGVPENRTSMADSVRALNLQTDSSRQYDY